MTNIIEYSNIFDPNIYSGIHSYHFFNTNIFRYSFVSTFWIRIYSDIRLWQDFDSNIFGYSFVSIFRTQTDSEDVFIDFLWILYFAYGYFVDINDQKCYLDCKSTELVPVLSRVWRIYSNIRIFSIRIFIRIFVRIEILIRIYSDIRSCQKCSYKYIRIFISVIFLTRIYSDIRSCQNPYECHTLVC